MDMKSSFINKTIYVYYCIKTKAWIETHIIRIMNCTNS